jgi:MFS superfamily sulfate permease-like transporter
LSDKKSLTFVDFLKKMKNNIPKDGFEGLTENFSSEVISGFLVFLLALPLSLGIASASDFPPIYGLVTAMIGGIVVSFISGSHLTIKGPAAGLIVIVASAVGEFAKMAPESVDDATKYGWHLTLGAIVIAGILQVLFGFLKLGRLCDFFPLSAVRGMLAAIGLIIISKQLHILLGFNPMTPENKPVVEPIELIMELKNSFANFFEHKDVVIIGLVSLAIVFGWPMIPIKAVKKIPSALVVLVVAIPLAMYLGIRNEGGYKPLLDFKEGLIDVIGINVSFNGFLNISVFVKYVIMFSIVGSLEALLTVKAIDMMDPFKRKSNTNKDLIAVGIGNIVSGILGGLPMISEVARSSANVNNGGKTRWANFFHGLFILLFLLFAVKFSDLIPKSALAAMLIGVGWKLAHPREFGHMFKIGLDQLVVFITTILVTLATDLMIGIGAGILIKLVLHVLRGVPFGSLFKANFEVNGDVIKVKGAIVFSNYLGLQKVISQFDQKKNLNLDVTNCNFLDHSVIESLHHLEDEFKNLGRSLNIIGLSDFNNLHGSKHHLAAKRKTM